MNQSIKYKDNWPLFEKILGYIRYLMIKKYIGKDSVCADIGCGFNGRFLRSVSSKIKYGYGFDMRANEGIYGNIEVINNSEFKGRIPLKDSSVDRVFMLAVLEHLDETAVHQLIGESVRILKSGGYLTLTTPTPVAKPVLEFLSYRLHIISEDSIREHKHYYSKQELVGLLKHNGLKVIKYKCFELGFNELIVGEKI